MSSMQLDKTDTENKSIPVVSILSMLANGESLDSVMQSFPSLSKEDILSCLSYPLIKRQQEAF